MQFVVEVVVPGHHRVQLREVRALDEHLADHHDAEAGVLEVVQGLPVALFRRHTAVVRRPVLGMRLGHLDGLAVHLEPLEHAGQQAVHRVDLVAARRTLHQDVVRLLFVISRVRVERPVLGPLEPPPQGLGVVKVLDGHGLPRREDDLPTDLLCVVGRLSGVVGLLLRGVGLLLGLGLVRPLGGGCLLGGSNCLLGGSGCLVLGGSGNANGLLDGVHLPAERLVVECGPVQVRHVDHHRDGVAQLVALHLGEREQDGPLERRLVEMGRVVLEAHDIRAEIRRRDEPLTFLLVRARVGDLGAKPLAHRPLTRHVTDGPALSTVGKLHERRDTTVLLGGGRVRSRRLDLYLELFDFLPLLLGKHLVRVVPGQWHPDVVAGLPEVLVVLLEHLAPRRLPRVLIDCSTFFHGAKAARPVHPRRQPAEALRHISHEGPVLLGESIDGSDREPFALDRNDVLGFQGRRSLRRPELVRRLCDAHLDTSVLVDGQDAPPAPVGPTALGGHGGRRQSQYQMTGDDEVARRPPRALGDRVHLVHDPRAKDHARQTLQQQENMGRLIQAHDDARTLPHCHLPQQLDGIVRLLVAQNPPALTGTAHVDLLDAVVLVVSPAGLGRVQEVHVGVQMRQGRLQPPGALQRLDEHRGDARLVAAERREKSGQRQLDDVGLPRPGRGHDLPGHDLAKGCRGAHVPHDGVSGGDLPPARGPLR